MTRLNLRKSGPASAQGYGLARAGLESRPAEKDQTSAQGSGSAREAKD
jgi:hypothetical protein